MMTDRDALLFTTQTVGIELTNLRVVVYLRLLFYYFFFPPSYPPQEMFNIIHLIVRKK